MSISLVGHLILGICRARPYRRHRTWEALLPEYYLTSTKSIARFLVSFSACIVLRQLMYLNGSGFMQCRLARRSNLLRICVLFHIFSQDCPPRCCMPHILLTIAWDEIHRSHTLKVHVHQHSLQGPSKSDDQAQDLESRYRMCRQPRIYLHVPILRNIDDRQPNRAVWRLWSSCAYGVTNTAGNGIYNHGIHS